MFMRESSLPLFKKIDYRPVKSNHDRRIRLRSLTLIIFGATILHSYQILVESHNFFLGCGWRPANKILEEKS